MCYWQCIFPAKEGGGMPDRTFTARLRLERDPVLCDDHMAR